MLAPSAFAELQADLRELEAAHQRTNGASQETARRRLRELDGEIGRLVDALASLGRSDAITSRLRLAEQEKSTLEAQLQRQPGKGSTIVADALTQYRRMIVRIEEALADQEDIARSRQILADLIGPVTVGLDAEAGKTFADYGDPAARLLQAAVGESLGLVAGARNASQLRIWF